jgi:hypothetical protein
MRLLAGVAVSCIALAADGPRVVYTKSFPGSSPAYVSITVERDGSCAYKEAVDEDPENFKLEPDVTTAIFDLAEKLSHFKNPLESGLKVAKMGDKTFRWENGTEKSEAKFNYSLDDNARLLHDWFERITESETLTFQLRRAIRYDRLGVNDAVLKIQAAWDRKRMVGLAQVVPLLDRVAQNEAFLHMARDRAMGLADVFRAALQKSPAAASNP